MKKFAAAFAVLALSVGIAHAADDPIAIRKDLMEANGAAAAVSAGLLKGEIPYNPVVAKEAIMALRAVSHAFGSFFPAGSDKGNTKASPKIWQDMAGFQATLAKFQKDTDAAAQASGKKGPADLAAFKAAITPVLGNCAACHRDYRLK
ncbi:MAG TPA: cytochrome c [Rhizobiaceae bacterium]|nr:cytochrome c [Rhizobiaceae bacterium]